MRVLVGSLCAIAVALLSACAPPTGATSFSGRFVAARAPGAAGIVATDDFKSIPNSAARLFSEDNETFQLRLLNCSYSVATASVDEQRLEGQLTPPGALLFASLVTDQAQVFASSLSGSTVVPENKYVGILNDATPIRIADRWPVPSLPCSSDYAAVMLIRDFRDVAQVDPQSTLDDDVVIIRVVTGPLQVLRNITPDAQLSAIQGIMIYDVVMAKDALTPAQEAELGSVAHEVVLGLIRALTPS